MSIITVKRVPNSKTETSHFKILKDGEYDFAVQITGRPDVQAAFLRVVEYCTKTHGVTLRPAGRDSEKHMQWTSEPAPVKPPKAPKLTKDQKVGITLLKKAIDAAQQSTVVNRISPTDLL